MKSKYILINLPLFPYNQYSSWHCCLLFLHNLSKLYHVLQLIFLSKYWIMLRLVLIFILRTHLSAVKFFQCDSKFMHHGFSFVWLPAPTHATHTSTKHHVEDVHGGAEASSTTSATTLLDCLLSSFVIDLSFVRVCQDFVGLNNGRIYYNNWQDWDENISLTCDISLNLSPASGFLSGWYFMASFL